MTPEITTVTAIVGAVCGVTALLLSFINTWHQLRRDQVRLKIVPYYAALTGILSNSHVNFGVNVINLSEFAVVLTDVGFCLDGETRGTLSTMKCVEPNGQLPLRLESHTSYTALFLLDRTTVPLTYVRCMYAQTQCGTLVRSSSMVLHRLIDGEANGHN